MKYKISMDNGSFVEIEMDAPINVNALDSVSWATVKSPTKAYYLNIAHITIIEEVKE